jgi:tRNA threonylcarbamoyladenosine biosynthesis protein TsaE
VSRQSDPVTWLARSAQHTQLIGARLAQALPPLTAQPAITYLTGELGAGKTTLARGFLEGRGFKSPVRSPTYTLLECYEVSDLVVVHLDLYRVQRESELEALGLRDLVAPNHLWLVEWPERGGRRLPPADLVVALQAEPLGHRVQLAARSALGAAWLDRAVELCSVSP